MEAQVDHVTTVAKMSNEELQGYLGARYLDHAVGLLPDYLTDENIRAQNEAECMRLVNEEAADFDDVGAWLVYCSCGWKGNNPYPGQTGALEGEKEHRFHLEQVAEEVPTDG